MDTDIKWVRESIDALQDALDGADGVCPFDTDVCGATLTREGHELTREGPGNGARRPETAAWGHTAESPLGAGREPQPRRNAN